MKPIKCDVFSTRSLSLSGPLTLKGNLYVDGDCDLVMCEVPVEIFGDVIIEGNLYASDIIIHGNLVCTTLNADSIEVDGNISVASIFETDIVKSNTGNIYISSYANIETLIAEEGSINIYGMNHDVSSISFIKAFDEIAISGDIIDVCELIAGTGVFVSGVISFLEADYFSEESISVSTYSGGIHSENINVN